MSNSWLWLERHLARQFMSQPFHASDPTLTMVCFIVGKPEPTAEAEFERYAETGTFSTLPWPCTLGPYQNRFSECNIALRLNIILSL